MRQISTYTIVLAVLLVGSCKKSPTSQGPEKYDSCLEFQIALRMTPLNVGDNYSNIIPINTNGGPYHVVSDANGMFVEMRWSDVEQVGQKGVEFTDFRWRFRNRLLCSDAETRWSDWTGPISPDTQGFPTEYELLMTPVSIHPQRHNGGDRPPLLFIRCRWMPSPPKVPDIDLRKYIQNQ